MELQELGKRAKAAEIIMRNLGMKEKENIFEKKSRFRMALF